MCAAPSRTRTPARCGPLALTAVLACSRLGAHGDDHRGDDRRAVEIADRPLADELQERLLALARAQGHLYWRLPGDDGRPRCEPWRLVPDGDGAERGRLVFAPPGSAVEPEASTLRLAYRLVDGHLSLTAPEHERPVAAAPGTRQEVGHALTCVFTGVSVAATADAARRVILVARERFFLTADACAGAGPADDPAGPDELRALGCAGALADPATRARLDRPPPASAPDAAARLRRARTVHVLRRGPDGRARCDAWRNHPERDGGQGRLVHRDSDARGAFTWTYAYDVGPGYVTLHGPAEVRRIELGGRRTAMVRASGCLLTRSVTAVTPTTLTIGPERWYLSKRACESARRAGAAGPPEGSPLLVPACE